MPSKPPRALLRRFLLTCSLPGLAASTACATRPPAPATLQLPVAATLRAPCPRPDRPAAPDTGALAAFSIRQEAAISTCEARKDAAVGVIDAANAALAALGKSRGER